MVAETALGEPDTVVLFTNIGPYNQLYMVASVPGHSGHWDGVEHKDSDSGIFRRLANWSPARWIIKKESAMGTYYAIGIVKKFKAQAKRAIAPPALEETVGKRLDLSLFELSHVDGTLEGTLKPGLFEKHIEGFVDKLTEIVPGDAETVRYCFENYGTDIDQYNSHSCRMRIPSPDGQLVDARADLVLVFLEGKVLAECFSIEPVLMNWLFRHSDFGNPLAGTVVSSIVG